MSKKNKENPILFLEFLWQNLRFLFQKKFQSSKYILEGKCCRCGACCRNIVFKIDETFVNSEEDFERLKKFKKIYNHFYISGRDKDRALLFTCKSLTDDNRCRDYFFRSFYCRSYPQIMPDFIANGGKLLDGCGYRYAVKKKFSEFL